MMIWYFWMKILNLDQNVAIFLTEAQWEMLRKEREKALDIHGPLSCFILLKTKRENKHQNRLAAFIIKKKEVTYTCMYVLPMPDVTQKPSKTRSSSTWRSRHTMTSYIVYMQSTKQQNINVTTYINVYALLHVFPTIILRFPENAANRSSKLKCDCIFCDAWTSYGKDMSMRGCPSYFRYISRGYQCHKGFILPRKTKRKRGIISVICTCWDGNWWLISKIFRFVRILLLYNQLYMLIIKKGWKILF